MNAFLIFCKRHRTPVREKYPHLENRSITKILGELWANLSKTEKGNYTQLAKEYKEAFMKANPEFKWYKLPSPPNRTLVTRPSNQRSVKLELVTTDSQSTSAPCGITPGKLADETQMGGLSSLIIPTVAPASPKLSNVSSSKPPKKRYLENGAFRSQPSEDTSTSSVNSRTTLPSSQSTAGDSQTVGDSQAASDCSALLKLAEMCSIELDRPNPSSGSGSRSVVINGRVAGSNSSGTMTTSTTTTTTSSSPTPSPPNISMPSVQSTANSVSATISPMNCTTASTTTSSSSSSSSSSLLLLSSSSSSSSTNSAVVASSSIPSSASAPAAAGGGPALSRFGKLIANAVSSGKCPSSTSNPGLFTFNLLPDRRSACQNSCRGAEVENEPLDLCKEKTITGSHQELIDCIVDGAFSSGSLPAKVPTFQKSRLQKMVNGPGSEAGEVGSSTPEREPAKGNYAEANQQLEDGRGGGGSGGSFSRKKAKGIHVGGDVASHESGGVDDANFLEAGDDKQDSSPRKSQRSCKGKRYQALMSEGVLQPAKDRKLNMARKPSSGDGYDGEYPDGNYPVHRTRTPSDSSESVTSRKSDKDDGQRNFKSSKSAASTDDELDGGHGNPDRLSPKLRHSSVDSTGSSRGRKRFKTGDFDLEAHIAALPKCNFEVLDRRKSKRPGSANSSGSSRKGNSSSKDDAKHLNEEADCLSEDGSDKADSSSSESRGERPILVGSQKRKARKRSITHLDPASGCSKPKPGVLGSMKLVALAEAAMCEERMPSSYNQNDGDSQTGSA